MSPLFCPQTTAGPEWILIDAKAHANEIESDCKEADPDSVRKIARALNETKEVLGVDIGRNRIKGCYQFTNRLAVLWFLEKHNIRAHLLIYFTGDKRPVRRNPAWNPQCPIDEVAWNKVLNKHTELVGLPESDPDCLVLTPFLIAVPFASPLHRVPRQIKGRQSAAARTNQHTAKENTWAKS